ncbi:MAG: hypothetical protein P8X58_08120 [Syntrophobacterales bacterium]
MSIICEKIHFERILCYPGSHKTIWANKEKPFGGLNPQPFFDCGGQGYRIISVKKYLGYEIPVELCQKPYGEH